jgi:uncharacterized membrane protein
MNKHWGVIKTTIIGGLIFLVPLVVLAAVFGKAFKVMMLVATPLEKLIPVEAVAGVALLDLLAILIMVLCCLLAGLAARSAWGRSIQGRIDALLLELIPSYSWIRGMTGSLSDEEVETVLKPVLARFDDQSQIAFEVERAGGMVALYVPGAPDTRSGSVTFVTEDRVQPLEAEFLAVVKSLKKLGRGSGSMLGGEG